MLFFAVDDDKTALKALHNALHAAAPYAEIHDFSSSSGALYAVCGERQKPDAVFTETRMPETDGMQLARAIRRESPDTKIIFVTKRRECALEAFGVHANSFLLKPISAEIIRGELEYLGIKNAPGKPMLTVRCLGNFEVFCNGKPLVFRRRMSKELFAYLVDRRGACCNAEEITAVLWENETDLRKAKHNLRNLVNDLRTSLRAVSCEDVLIRRSGMLAVDCSLLDCDYFNMLSGGTSSSEVFRGEYMNQYEWAQLTEARLYFGG